MILSHSKFKKLTIQARTLQLINKINEEIYIYLYIIYTNTHANKMCLPLFHKYLQTIQVDWRVSHKLMLYKFAITVQVQY